MPASRRPERGSSAKGRRTRQQLLTAAGALLMEQGFSAMSHRAVAQRAELPLSATTYYFATLDELLEQALTSLAEQWFSAALAVVDGLPARLQGVPQIARAVLAVATLAPVETADTEALLTVYGRYLEAARQPRLRPIIAAYNTRVEGLISEILSRGGLRDEPQDAALVLAVVDGALLRALGEGLPLASAVGSVERMLAS